MIDRFTTQQFEEALPNGAAFHAILDGERVYDLSVNPHVHIFIRSTIAGNGIARDTGEDSIRMWIEVLREDGSRQSLAKDEDLSRYTTRVPGWETRMNDKIKELQKIAERITSPIPLCDDCAKPKILRITKKEGPNKGRPFASCPNRAHNGFVWMDREIASSTTPNKQAGKDVFSGKTKTTVSDLFADVELATSFPSEEEEEQEEVVISREPNDQQKAIIVAPIDKNIRVLAGPGSGKTFTSERRVVHLIREHGARPGQILYVTFSKTMADEGAKRIGQTLERELCLSPMEIAEYQKWFCTIHAACFRMLRADGFQANVAAPWQIKKAIEPLIDEYWKDCEMDDYIRPSAEEIYKAICNAKMYAQRPDHDKSFFCQFFGDYHGVRLSPVRKKFDRAMEAIDYKTGKRLTTFPDMLYEVERRLMDDQAFLERWQGQFRHVIVDEGQDTNAQGMRVLTTLAEGNHFMVVGDTDQLLMRFTGASPEENLYDGFSRRYPDGRLFMLETNYRSTIELVETANKVIRFNYQADHGPYEDMFRKILKARDGADFGAKISFHSYSDPVDEAAALVANIQEQLAKGRQPGDMFVGARTRAQLGYLEGPLTAAGIKFINIKGGSFWLQKHVNDVVSYLRLAHDPGNKDAFKRVYNIASKWFKAPWGDHKGEYVNQRWLGAQFLTACNDSFRNAYSAARQRRAWQPGVDDLATLIEVIQAGLFQEGPEKALRVIVDDCYQAYLEYEEGNPEQDEADGGKLNDLMTVIDLASRFKDVDDFLRHVDEAIEAATKAKDRDWDEYVVLSTVHGLKGLERKVVFGVGISEGEVVTKSGGSVPYGLLPHTFSLTDPPQMGAFKFGGRSRIEDERCIFFVLITRAKEEVILSGVEHYRKATMWPSRFLFEAGVLNADQVENPMIDRFSSYQRGGHYEFVGEEEESY